MHLTCLCFFGDIYLTLAGQLAPQLQAPFSAGSAAAGGGSFPKPEADSARIPASGGPGRRSGPAAAPRSKPAHLQPAWRPEHPPLNSLGGFSPNFSGERRPVGQLSHNSADAARGHQARDKASLPRPRASDDVLGRRPAPLLTPRRAQPGLRYAKVLPDSGL